MNTNNNNYNNEMEKKQKSVLLELRSGADAIQSFKCIVLNNVGALYQ